MISGQRSFLTLNISVYCKTQNFTFQGTFMPIFNLSSSSALCLHLAILLIKTFRKKLYKYMASVSKNVDIDNLDDIVNKYNNTYHGTIKVKPVEVKPIKSKTYFDPCKEINDKDPKIKIGDFVRISKYKNIFGNNSTPNWLQEVFVVKKVRNTVPYTNVINGLNGEEIVGKFYENELEKSNQKGFITVKNQKEKR